MVTTFNTEIEQITQSVFSTMLEIETARVESGSLPEDESLAALIHITGEWVGSVVLSMSLETALSIASQMLQLPGDEVTDADKEDTAAELVNMIGGNLKSLLPGSSALSLPTIIAGNTVAIRMHTAELIDDVWMASGIGSLRVQLYERTAKSA